jgi:polyisoprenoid-binding protein YceI
VVVAVKFFAVLLCFGFAVPAAAEIGRWQIDYGASRLDFTAEQAGAEFRGAFQSFDADVRFDPAALAQSSALVFVDTASLNTSDQERDGILRGAGWFEVEAFPRAQFAARDFTATDTGFAARGELTIRGASVPVTFEFSLVERDGRIELTGTADLDRFALGLGLGDWADTQWIGQKVQVNVTLIGHR